MKMRITRLLSLFLIFTMLFSLTSTALAAQNIADIDEDISVEEDDSNLDISDDLQAAKDIYASLSSEAKAIFDQAIADDSKLLEFHKTYVDPQYEVSDACAKSSEIATQSAVSDSMSILNAQLVALSLPTAVVYSLKAMGAGMVAAIADGPLPVGDILLAATTASAVVVVAANWNKVSSKWSKIVSAYKKAFSDSAKNVVSAFKTLKKDISSELTINPCLTVSKKKITINGVTYNCTTKASELTSSQKKGKKYMPAVLYQKAVWVAASVSLTDSQAKIIRACNNSQVGVWAMSSSYARGLCGGNSAIWHNTHSNSEGYYYHYHHPSYPKFHCWYL